ncbi:CopG family transcriptional regulator [Acinetobacter pittii]|uniref:ribbon-helix-helix domain-containing protein n=1 Tax=Acinetobacter pittii TaxID=48296 RepID=UPI003A89E2AA
MNTIHEDFLTDTKSVPVKIHLPARLVEQLNTFCDSTKISKSELIREYLIKGLQAEPAWANKLFFFKKRTVDQQFRITQQLKNPAINSIIKLAVNSIDNPGSANLVLGYLVKTSGDRVSVLIPPTRPFHPSFNNAHFEIQDISTTDPNLSIPEVENVINTWGQPLSTFIYTVPVDFVWEICT